MRQTIHVPDAKFLVGIAMDPDRQLLLADLLASRISTLKDGTVRMLQEGAELLSPSKLHWAENGLVVSSWGFTTDFSGDHLGSIFSWNVANREITPWAVPMTGHWLGLCPNGAGGWFAADFESGAIIQVLKSGVCEKIISLGYGLGAVLYLPEDRLLVAAHITENRVIAFHLTESVALR